MDSGEQFGSSFREQSKNIFGNKGDSEIFLGNAEHGPPWGPPLTWDTLKALYASIFEPNFRYCSSVWGKFGVTDKNHLQKLQNQAARILTNSHYDADARPLLNNFTLWFSRSLTVKHQNICHVYL